MRSFACLQRIKQQNPLVHCIQNHVTAGDCANALLAVGASPIMAEAVEEAAEIAAQSAGLVLNLGTLSATKIEAMLLAGKAANHHGIPVLLDPVGVGASHFRREAAMRLLAQVRFAAIRGNHAEIAALLGKTADAHGVGVSAEQAPAYMEEHARLLAQSYRCVVAVTGKVDLVVSQTQKAVVCNGTPAMARLTGAGCMLSALSGAFLAVADSPFEALLQSVVFMGICGEKASAQSAYTGSLRMHLLDAFCNTTSADLAERARIYESN